MATRVKKPSTKKKAEEIVSVTGNPLLKQITDSIMLAMQKENIDTKTLARILSATTPYVEYVLERKTFLTPVYYQNFLDALGYEFVVQIKKKDV